MSKFHQFGKQAKNVQNFFYFHGRRIAVNVCFLSSFSLFVYKNLENENEILRIALAGCISHTTVETGFHMIDTVNIRSKANPHLGTSSMTSLV